VPRQTRGIARRTPQEIEKLEDAARLVAEVLRLTREACAEGTRTDDIDAIAREHIAGAGATSLFEGYNPGDSIPFPAQTCISVNEEVVHGIPSSRRLERGDLVCIDVGISLDGWCGDSATSLIVGGPDANLIAAKLQANTRGVLELGLSMILPGRKWSEIGSEMERLSGERGAGIVTEFVGHGIGRELHEPPKVPAYWSGFRGEDFELREGMVISIEPMLTEGRGDPSGRNGRAGFPDFRMPVEVDPRDGWTVRTSDGGLSCHEERVVAVTSDGGRMLGGLPIAPE
jgi:methionyl aminopeptidase